MAVWPCISMHVHSEEYFYFGFLSSGLRRKLPTRLTFLCYAVIPLCACKHPTVFSWYYLCWCWCVASNQVVVCSRSKVDWKVFLGPVFFPPEAHRGRCDKEKGSQVADCWVFLANNLKTRFYFSLAFSHSLSVSYYLSLTVFSLSFSPTHKYST